MADLINLNKARKAKARAQKTVTAQQNRVRFGTPAALRLAARGQRSLDAARLDGVKRNGMRSETFEGGSGEDQ